MTENDQGGKGTTLGTSLPLRPNPLGYGTQLCRNHGGRSRFALLAHLDFANAQAVSRHSRNGRNPASADLSTHEVCRSGRPYLCGDPRGLCGRVSGATSRTQSAADFNRTSPTQHGSVRGLCGICPEKARSTRQLCRDARRPFGHQRSGIHRSPHLCARHHGHPQRAYDARNESRPT